MLDKEFIVDCFFFPRELKRNVYRWLIENRNYSSNYINNDADYIVCNMIGGNSNYYGLEFVKSRFPTLPIITYNTFMELISFKLPEKWYVVRNSENYRTINNWFNSKRGPSGSYCFAKGNLYYSNTEYSTWHSLGFMPVYDDDIKNEYTEITFEQFKKYVIDMDLQKLETKQETKNSVMKIIIPADIVRDGYNDMSPSQKELFESGVNAFTGETTQEFISKFYNEGDICNIWKERIEKLYPFVLSRNITITFDTLADKKPHFGQNLGERGSMIAPRTGGKYAKIGYALNVAYDWELVTDNINPLIKVLIPKLKEKN